MSEDFLPTGAGPVTVGDWIRFLRDGRLVISLVEYIYHYDPLVNVSSGHGPGVCTTDGFVYVDAIREIRRKP